MYRHFLYKNVYYNYARKQMAKTHLFHFISAENLQRKQKWSEKGKNDFKMRILLKIITQWSLQKKTLHAWHSKHSM